MSSIPFPSGISPQQFIQLLSTNVTAALSLLSPADRARLLLAMRTHNTSQPTNVTVENVTTEVVLINTTIIGGEPDFSSEKSLIIAYAIIIIIASILGILGNLLVVVLYGRKGKNLSIIKSLILHLALADLLFSILQIALAAPSVRAADWPYGEGACKFIRSCVTLGSLVAIGSLLIIALERYLAIVHSMKFTGQGSRVLILLVVVWVAAIVSVIPSGIALRFDVSKGDCEEEWTHSGLTKVGAKVYDFYLLIVWFIVPMAFIGYCYTRIILLLRNPLEKRGFSKEAESDFVKRRRKEDMKAVKTLVVAVVVFFICCLPIRIMWILFKYIDTDSMSESSYFALLYTGLLPYPCHVAANPVIYSAVDSKFRAELIEFFHLRQLLTTIREGSILRRPTLGTKSTYATSSSENPSLGMKKSVASESDVNVHVIGVKATEKM